MIKIETNKTDGVTEFLVSGELDLHNCGELKNEVVKNLEPRTTACFNLQKLKYTDSSGIATFVDLMQTLNKKNVKMKLTKVPKNIYEIFNLVRLTELFDIETL